ncbi:MAG: PQQ-binding-like beta-propeller repeat protein [Planctomycetota bacterium]
MPNPPSSNHAGWHILRVWLAPAVIGALTYGLIMLVGGSIGGEGSRRGPTWSSKRPLFVDVDGDGTEDLIGTVYVSRAIKRRVAAYSGVDGANLWISDATDDLGQSDERHLWLTLESGALRAVVEENEVWLRPQDGSIVERPESAAVEPMKTMSAGWSFPDKAKINHTQLHRVERLDDAMESRRALTRDGARALIRGETTRFDGFTRKQEAFPLGAPLEASFGRFEDDRPGLIGYRRQNGLEPDEEVWRRAIGGEDATALPGFTAIDCDASAIAVVYRRGERGSDPLGASLVDFSDGSVAWNVHVPGHAFGGITLRGDRVYVATLDGMSVLDRGNGARLFCVALRR